VIGFRLRRLPGTRERRFPVPHPLRHPEALSDERLAQGHRSLREILSLDRHFYPTNLIPLHSEE
jgi:hypothetical protein